jgi:hypothetical protein
LKKPGRYEVCFAYQHGTSRATNVPVTIFHADGETTVHVNEQEAPVIDGRFVSLGQFRFEANGFGYALISNEGTIGHVTADAVQFLPAESVAGEVAKLGTKTEEKDNTATKAASGRIKSLEERLKKLQESGPKRPLAMSVREEEEIEDTFIHVRGSVHNLGARVPRGFLQVATLTVPALPEHQSGRREFADWIASPSNPLTARVMVNRVWHWLFGAGLVRTTDNFGTMGEAPSHPELLDYLATEFIEQNWAVKRLVRETVLSRTYQLSWRDELRDSPSDRSKTRAIRPSEIDPENRLLGHANRRRLDAECLRDSMLFVSGQLNNQYGGPSFASNISADYGFVYTEPRRSIYIPAFRNSLPEILEVFDFADPSTVVGVRNVSTVAPQALFLMNHPFTRDQARAAARRLLSDNLGNDSARLEMAYRRTLGRSPTPGEKALAGRRLTGTDEALDIWTNIFHALFASPDFRYVN